MIAAAAILAATLVASLLGGNDRVAVIDGLNNEVRVIETATNRTTTLHTAETPVDAAFAGNAIYVAARDARLLERFDSSGARTSSLPLAADPAFVREANGKLYVYSRAEGVLQEIITAPLRVARSVRVAAFGSDLEVGGGRAYIALPRAGKIAVVNILTMSNAGMMDAGAVPVDIAFTSSGSALTARTLAIADPSAKKVWLIEGAQSLTQSVARGFLRGLIGLGLFGGRSSQFPTGVDRVFARGGRWYAFDSSSGTLYRFTKTKSSVVAKNVAATGLAVTPSGIYVWNEAVRRLQKLEVQ